MSIHVHVHVYIYILVILCLKYTGVYRGILIKQTWLRQVE